METVAGTVPEDFDLLELSRTRRPLRRVLSPHCGTVPAASTAARSTHGAFLALEPGTIFCTSSESTTSQKYRLILKQTKGDFLI
jgi:hypothetical protein